MAERKCKAPNAARQRLEALARDNYTCMSCGRSPAITPGLALEVDHSSTAMLPYRLANLRGRRQGQISVKRRRAPDGAMRNPNRS